MGQKPNDDGGSGKEPSLELPSLKLPVLGRKKRSKKQEPMREPAQEPATPEPEPATRVLVEDTAAPTTESQRKGVGFPGIPGQVAAVLTGLVVGAFGTLLTYLAMGGCEWVRGTSTCGDAGFFLLVAILALMILLGTLLLKVCQVSDPGGTSFLAVGVVTVVVLLLLVDVLFSGWMFLVVPVIAAASYLLSRWVTTRFVDAADGHRPGS